MNEVSPLYALQRLATGEWFTSRISACGLFAGAYARTTGSQRAELRQLYGLLCRDETPMVRSQLLLKEPALRMHLYITRRLAHASDLIHVRDVIQECKSP